MYAQLVRRRTTPHERAGVPVRRIVADEVIPALQDQPGFAGALSLVNARTGETIVIVLWNSAEHAQRPRGVNGTEVLAPLSPAGTSFGDRQSTSFWEVTVRV